jgi:hypothetical protein
VGELNALLSEWTNKTGWDRNAGEGKWKIRGKGISLI